MLKSGFFSKTSVLCLITGIFFSENMIRGLDSDETLFLDLVSKQQEEIASRRFNEETQEIREYRVRWQLSICTSINIFSIWVSFLTKSIDH